MPRFDRIDIQPTKIVGGEVAMPSDLQMIYRKQEFITTTPLGGNASYNGASIDGISFKRLTGKIFSNVSGTLHIEQSDDGIVWDRLSSYTISANTPLKYDDTLVSQYVRPVYVNDATAQTIFRLSGYLSVQ